MTSQEGPGVLIGRGWGSIEGIRSEGRPSWTRNSTRLRKQELSVKLTSGTFRPGLISSKTIFPLGRLSGGSVRLLVYSPLTLKENTEQTVLISPVGMSKVPRVASSMFPMLLKKFLESVPQTSCSVLHAMLWSAKAAEMN